MSVGPPSARAVSDGSHDSMNGTAVKATPRAPYTVVAVRRNLPRLRSGWLAEPRKSSSVADIFS